MTKGSPQNRKIFDTELLSKRRDRAQRRAGQFFTERCVEDLAGRLLDINRNFENVAYFGPEDGLRQLKSLLPSTKLPNNIACNPAPEHLPVGELDLVIHLLRLQSENDPGEHLTQVSKSLRPDGLFIAAFFGGTTLQELRQAFYVADTECLGGLTPRILPFANHTQAAGLLSRAGLKLPVVDIDRFSVSYSAFETLITDLRDLGETNTVLVRDRSYLGRSYLACLKSAYEKLDEQEGYNSSFEILWLTGWSAHDSQQKPLKPGSGQMPLGEAINSMAKP